MPAYSRSSTLAAYQSVATHGGAGAPDPHQLVLMLMDGALERIAKARSCLQHGALAEKSHLIHAATLIIEELRASLDMNDGGSIAVHLDDLYEYMGRQLVQADLANRAESLAEVGHLLSEIRTAWIALPAEARALRPEAK